MLHVVGYIVNYKTERCFFFQVAGKIQNLKVRSIHHDLRVVTLKILLQKLIIMKILRMQLLKKYIERSNIQNPH